MTLTFNTHISSYILPNFRSLAAIVSEISTAFTFSYRKTYIYGRGGHLGHVTSIMSSDFHFLVPESFHTKFGSDGHSNF